MTLTLVGAGSESNQVERDHERIHFLREITNMKGKSRGKIEWFWCFVNLCDFLFFCSFSRLNQNFQHFHFHQNTMKKIFPYQISLLNLQYFHNILSDYVSYLRRLFPRVRCYVNRINAKRRSSLTHKSGRMHEDGAATWRAWTIHMCPSSRAERTASSSIRIWIGICSVILYVLRWGACLQHRQGR